MLNFYQYLWILGSGGAYLSDTPGQLGSVGVPKYTMHIHTLIQVATMLVGGYADDGFIVQALGIDALDMQAYL